MEKDRYLVVCGSGMHSAAGEKEQLAGMLSDRDCQCAGATQTFYLGGESDA